MRPGPRRPRPAAAIAVLVLTGVGAGVAARPVASDETPLRTALLAADDARVRGEVHAAAVARGLASASPEVRVLALRAAGRTTRHEFLAPAVEALRDPSIDVRREAAFAVGHIGTSAAAVVPATAALLEAMTREGDVLVFGSLAENLGRVPAGDAAGIERTVVAVRGALHRLAAGRDPAPAVLGATRGAEALARRAARLKATSPALRDWLEALWAAAAPAAALTATHARQAPVDARIRRAAISGLLALDAVSPSRTAAALADPDAQVRRLGVLALERRQTLPADAGMVQLKDPSILVRHAVVSRLGPRRPALATAALEDARLNVRLAALDALGQAGACRQSCTSRLAAGPQRDDAWHEPAHALVALARTAPGMARPHVARASGAPTWQARMYAARAAGLTKQTDLLRTLAADAHVNVRHAALSSWRDAGLPGFVDAARDALAADDGQLLIEAATALKGAVASAGAVEALRGALGRLTDLRHDTSRDARMALLERIDELDPDRATTLRGWLADSDAVVADRAAALINARLGPGQPRVVASPSSSGGAALRRVRVPGWTEVQALDRSAIKFTLRRKRALTMRLFAQVAPTAVARLVDQVRAGEWNGRTLHRVEPGFVVQGGSPAANEYAGAASYTRDEFSSLSNLRGTVGISTRGPDTGDGQIYVNLVDNVRLDFAFTVIGAMEGDLDDLDKLVEGETIISAAVVGPR